MRTTSAQENSAKSIGSGRYELEPLARSRMGQRKRQWHAAPVGEKKPPPPALPPYKGSPRQGWPIDARMHADLMHSAGVGFHPHQRCSQFVAVAGIESREYRDMADGVARRTRSHRHPLALDRMPPDRPLNRHPFRAREFAFHDRKVSFFNGAILELPRKARCARTAVRATTITPDVSLSRRCTMPGRSTPSGSAHRSQLGKSREQCVHQRAIGMPGGRMHGHPRRLVHDDYFVVVEKLRKSPARLLPCNSKESYRAPAGIAATVDAIPRAHSARRGAPRTAPLTVTSPRLDHSRHLRARVLRRQPHRHEHVQPHAVVLGARGDCRWQKSRGAT